MSNPNMNHRKMVPCNGLVYQIFFKHDLVTLTFLDAYKLRPIELLLCIYTILQNGHEYGIDMLISIYFTKSNRKFINIIRIK